MMDSLFWRYLLEYAMLVPAVAIALMPVIRQLRFGLSAVLIQAAVAVAVMSVGGAALSTAFRIPSSTVMFPCAVPLFLIYRRIVRLSLNRTAFCFLNAVMLCTFSTLYTVILMADVEAVDPDLPFHIESSLICLGLSVLTALLYSKTLIKRVPDVMREKKLNDLWWWACLYMTALTALLWWAVPDDPANVLVGRVRSITLVISLIPALGTLELYMLTHWIARNMAESAKLEQDNRLLRMEQKRYLELKSYMDETRIQRHDFRQHLRVIHALSAKGQTEELNAYLSQYENSVGEEHPQYCQNAAVDAIAAYYDQLAAAQDSRIHWTLELPTQTDLTESDLCVIIGNLTENALTAMKELPPERRDMIFIIKKLSDAMTGITVENPYVGTLRFDDRGLPVTQSEEHGVGLASVAAIVDKNKGELSINAKDNVFSISALLYS